MKTNKDNALLVAGLIFSVVALAHLLRLILHFNLLIARYLIPEWVSIPGFIIFFGLAIWMFMARSSRGK
jgi:hypothetical protein